MISQNDDRRTRIQMSEDRDTVMQDYIDAVSRRRKLLLLVAGSILAIGILFALLLPAIYRSEAIILIEQQEIPTELVRSTVTSFADQRIQVISQRVMTSSNLTEIIQKYGLYELESAKEPREVVIEIMRNDITREMISADVVDPRSGRPTEATIAFRLAFNSKSPQLAQKVTNELVSLYLNENIKNRTESAAETVSFLADEAQRLGRNVSQLEQELATFKSNNGANLPELEELTRSQMNRIELEIAEIDRRIDASSQQKIYLEGELAQLEPYRTMDRRDADSPVIQLERAQAALTAAEASYAETHPDVIRLKKQVAALREDVEPGAAQVIYEKQLEDARAALNAALNSYGQDHPDVIAAKRVVENLQNRLVALPEIEMEEAGNPAYIVMRARLESAASELRSLAAKRTDLIAKYDAALTNLAKMPETEAKYRGINRQYENTVAKYREVTAKQMEARLSSNLESDRKGERFTLIEPPLLPEKPTSPNRVAIMLISLMLAFAGGFGTVGLVEMADTKVRGRRGIQDILGVPPLATVPYVLAAGEKERGTSVIKAASVFGGLVILTLIAFHYLYKPLDVLWFVALRKVGF